MAKTYVCANCGDSAIEQTRKFIWVEGRWVENDGEYIYDCPECGECEIKEVEV